MRKFSLVLAMLALVLVFGFTLVGCDSGVKDAPNLMTLVTSSRSGTEGNYSYTNTTSFSAGQLVVFRYSFTAPYQDLGMAQIVIKRDGTVRYAMQSSNMNVPKGDATRNFTWGPWSTYPPGSYTAELYIEDIDGKRSDTLSTSFTVTP